MKKTLLTALTFLLFAAGAMSQISIPAPSPAGSVYSKVGLTDVTIDYYRPKVKGRKIFGEGSDYLQPYGQIWRSGANSGSKLTLSTDAEIAGKNIPAGEYMIYTIPGKDEWSFMVYTDLNLGGSVGSYNTENEILRATVKPTTLAQKVETLTFNISDISEDNTSANIQLAWDDISIKVPLKVAFDDVIMKDIQAKTQVNPANYITAANYYYTTGKDLNQALDWVNRYLAVGDNSKQFWNVHLKAQILAKLGKKKEAIEAANKSMELAKNNEGGDFGYVKRNQDLIVSLK